MTRRTLLRMGLAGAVAPLHSYAYVKEFWNERKPSEWTPDEVQLLLSKSPWAKDAIVSYYGGQNGPLSTTVPGQSNRRGSQSKGSAPSATSPAAWKAIVRWQSALPIQEALQLPTKDIDKYYVLNMVGDVPSVGADPDGIEVLKLNTKLEHKGDQMQLHHVAVSLKNNLSMAGTLFYFSRDLALRLKDKQAIFSTKLGPIDVKCKFTLSEMMYRGNLEL